MSQKFYVKFKSKYGVGIKIQDENYEEYWEDKVLSYKNFPEW